MLNAQVRLTSAIRSLLFVVAVSWLGARTASAEQFVLFDVTFTFTKKDADNSKPSPSHYYVRDKLMNTERPKDWTSPVDYRNGTAHVRLEVLEKPAGDEATTWSVCYIPNKGQKNGYGCFNTPVYKEAGVFEQDISMTKFWQNDSIVWEQGIKEMHLVIKDNSGGSGHAHKRPDHEKFFPTKVRMTVIQVSAGSKYDPKLVLDISTAHSSTLAVTAMLSTRTTGQAIFSKAALSRSLAKVANADWPSCVTSNGIPCARTSWVKLKFCGGFQFLPDRSLRTIVCGR